MLMKRMLFILAALAVFTFSAFGQTENLDMLLPLLEKNRISLDYDCTITTNNVPVNYQGNIVIQNGCYILKGNGVEIYCDGGTRWTVDPKIKEVYIEYAEGLDDILANRASITRLEIKQGSVKLTPIEALPENYLDEFSFKTSELDSSWVVTDMR